MLGVPHAPREQKHGGTVNTELDPRNISAVLVTRGVVPLDEIIREITSAGIEDIVVWNNSERPNIRCYGRYLGIAEAKNDVIFHMDDDLIPPVAKILAAYRPIEDRYTVVANNRVDEDWQLTGIGSVFHRQLANCFKPYLRAYGESDDFHRTCDVVFAYTNAYRRVAFGYWDLPWCSDPQASMYLEPGHMESRFLTRARTLMLPNVLL